MDASQEVCAICLDTIKESKAILEECRHIFCKICIDKWTEIRLKCPVCNHELKSLSSKKKILQTQNVEAPEEQFECLDHNYFMTEFLILQTKLNDTKFLLKKDTKLSRFNNAWDALEMTQFEITQKLTVLADLRMICPKNYLADVYRIDQCFKDIGSGNFREMDLLKLEKLKQTGEVNDDYYYYDENGEEYYDDDNYYDNKNFESPECETYYSCITSIEVKKKPKNKKKNNKKGASTKLKQSGSSQGLKIRPSQEL